MNSILKTVITAVNSWVWSPALVALCLLAGLYFSLGTRFVQVRRLREMVRLLFSTDQTQKKGITSFQAFAMALSGRVGTGNIVGVTTAIGYGGPGAIVWMWIVAFLGAGSAFTEATLAQIYKTEHNGQYRGGPSYYIEKGLRCRWLAIVFATCAVVACGIFLPPVQANGIAQSFSQTFNIAPWIAGIGVALLLGFVVIGGVNRIANWAQIIAPFMAILYVLLSVVILCCNAPQVPGVFMDMLRSAFDFRGVTGGVLGATIAWGVKRGIYSNEAGQGTAPIVAAAAKVSHPVKQGLVQAFSVYVDTLLVCTATAVMILACRTYNLYLPDGTIRYASPVVPLGEPGVGYTIAAVATLIGQNWSGIVTSIALLFFAFTTIMAYYYYAETNLVYLLGQGKKERIALWILRIGVVCMVLFGSIKEARLIWDLGDIGVGTMAWINIVSILLLSPKALRALRSYERQKKEGHEPHFDPTTLGIKGADFWEAPKANSTTDNPLETSEYPAPHPTE
ncbi:MAG: alanine:cation symporter family protein [Bacteroidales bacterium]|nr:alanine:cation symporter family protein [Bacteroidales bacterium]